MTRIVSLLAFFAMLLLAGCRSQPGQESQSAKKYQLRGVVLEVNKDKREVRLKHQDIPGYMRGMTMNFPVRDDAALATLAPNDEITADLNVSAPGEFWLSNIHRTSR
jgi:protein SCO1/2